VKNFKDNKTENDRSSHEFQCRWRR